MSNKNYYRIIFLFAVILFGCGRNISSISDRGEWISLSDTDSAHGCYMFHNNHIYKGWVTPSEYITRLDTIPYVDMPTFKVCKGTNYAKDKNRVYYPLSYSFWDGMDCGGENIDEYIILTADPETFKYLGNDYAIDRHNMYYKGEIVPWDETIIKGKK